MNVGHDFHDVLVYHIMDGKLVSLDFLSLMQLLLQLDLVKHPLQVHFHLLAGLSFVHSALNLNISANRLVQSVLL